MPVRRVNSSFHSISPSEYAHTAPDNGGHHAGIVHVCNTGLHPSRLVRGKIFCKQSRGTTVYWMMWQGDPMINRYVQEYVVPEVKKRFDINLKPVPGQGNEVVKVLMAEQEAGVNHSAVDLCWINGETFFQLRQIAGLYGPFTDKLPGIQYVDLENPFIGTDFQQKTDGYECPWGNVQLAVIYDSLRTPAPPRDLACAGTVAARAPGKFTIPYDFTGMTLLKSWMIAFGGSSEILDGPFREDLYLKLSGELWGYINRNKSFSGKRNNFPGKSGCYAPDVCQWRTGFYLLQQPQRGGQQNRAGCFPW
jgi:ABC-type uncharacterized transport system YnjBCD substrate-binding protein